MKLIKQLCICIVFGFSQTIKSADIELLNKLNKPIAYAFGTRSNPPKIEQMSTVKAGDTAKVNNIDISKTPQLLLGEVGKSDMAILYEFPNTVKKIHIRIVADKGTYKLEPQTTLGISRSGNVSQNDIKLIGTRGTTPQRPAAQPAAPQPAPVVKMPVQDKPASRPNLPPAEPEIPQAPAGAPATYAGQKITITPAASERIEAGKKAIQNEISNLNKNINTADVHELKARYETIMDQLRQLKSFLGSPTNRDWAQKAQAALQQRRAAINKRITEEEAAAMQQIPQAPPLDIPQAPPLGPVPVIPEAPPLIPQAPPMGSAIPQAPPMGAVAGKVPMAPQMTTVPAAAAAPSPQAPASVRPTNAPSADLLADIQKGTKLKKAEAAAKVETEQSIIAKRRAAVKEEASEDADIEAVPTAGSQTMVTKEMIDLLANDILKQYKKEFPNITQAIARDTARGLYEAGYITTGWEKGIGDKKGTMTSGWEKRNKNAENAAYLLIKKHFPELATAASAKSGPIGLPVAGYKGPKQDVIQKQNNDDWET